MKKITLLIYGISILGYSQTPITDSNFQNAINTCLSNNPVDGLCSSSEYGAMPDWDVSQVTNMNEAFKNKYIFNADISAWDVSNVTTMKSMFSYAADLRANISAWDVSSVTNMSNMFNGPTDFNSNFSSWDVRSVTDMNGMFFGVLFNPDISTWNVSSVTDMSTMFEWSVVNQDLNSWDISNVTNMERMFNTSSLTAENYDTILTGWSTLTLQQNVSLGAVGIKYCASETARQSIIDNFGWSITDAGLDCSAGPITITDTNFETAINTCLSTNPIDGLCSSSEYGAMPDWDVSQVTNMNEAFRNKADFNADIGAWNVSSVNNMNYMFYGAAKFNEYINSWDLSNVTTMKFMFWDAILFNKNISAWNVSSLTDMTFMFKGATSFNQDLSTWDVSKVTDMSSMFDNSALSTQSYDAILTGWSSLNLQQNISLGAAGINYCSSQTAKQSIIDNFGWTITDAGLDCSSLSIDDQSNPLSFSIYPNPTKNSLFIESNKKIIAVSIYNVFGKKILSTKSTNQIDIKELANGVYIIRISDGSNQSNKKFMKF